VTLFEFRAQKMSPRTGQTWPNLAQRVEKSVSETLSLIIFVSDRVSIRYGENVTDVDISECVTESVSVNSMDKSDGGNAPVAVSNILVFFVKTLDIIILRESYASRVTMGAPQRYIHKILKITVCRINDQIAAIVVADSKSCMIRFKSRPGRDIHQTQAKF
jgi:hypothetical protein